MKFCPNYAIPLHATTDNKVYVARARCKQWSCPYCAHKNRNIWVARATEHVKADGGVWYFWTLTLAPKDHVSLIHSLRVWRGVWAKFAQKIRRDVKRATGASWQYLRVFEAHKSGVLHVHILSDYQYPDTKPITDGNGDVRYHSDTFKQDVLHRYGLGYVHDMRPCVIGDDSDMTDGDKARITASYVTKYLTKDMQSGIRDTLSRAGMGRIRQIQTSQGWYDISRGKSQYDWHIGGITVDDWLSDTSHDYIDLDLDKPIYLEDFYADGAHRVYPAPKQTD